MSRKEATIIQNFNAEKRKYEYSIKGYDVTKSIKILLKKHKEEYDKERRVFESTKGYLEAQQEYEKHIANLQSQLDKANERLGKLEDILEKYGIESMEELKTKLDITNESIKKAQQKLAEIYIQDRDTWKRACKEACDVLRDINYKIYNEDRIDFENIFYQQVTGKLPAN